ncbi:MAG: VWA domain-containing protein [Candidatus Acidiferrales bacterium]
MSRGVKCLGTARLALRCGLLFSAVIACAIALAWSTPAAFAQDSANSTNGTQTSPAPAAPPPASAQVPAGQSAPPSQSSNAPVSGSTAVPQSSAAPTPVEPEAPAPEVDTHSSAVPFQVRVNLVPVRVIVRDAKGRAVGNLTRDDFMVLQDGKPQTITNFTVETPAALLAKVANPPSETDAAGTPQSPATEPPSRFVALLFDDVHLSLQDLMNARLAADHYVASSLATTDRVAVFTISGQTQMDFTAERAKLTDTLNHLMPRAVGAGDPTGGSECPPIDYYEAAQIVDIHDSEAMAVATQDALYCLNQGNISANATTAAAQLQSAQMEAQADAVRILNEGDIQTTFALRRLLEVVRRMSTLPGQRGIVLVSPGFIYPEHEAELSTLIERALRSDVFIHTLDARGLYTPDPGQDISQPGYVGNPTLAGQRESLRIAGQNSQMEVLMALSDGTGGVAFHNNNDLDAGFRMIAATPEVSYVIAYAPLNLKNDGRFHTLKVKLTVKEKYEVQARRGFFAPTKSQTPQELAEQDIRDAVFSQDELRGLPIEIQTQYYSTGPAAAKLAVLGHVNISGMQFEKADGRNDDDLTVVTAIFDNNGNFVSAEEKTVQMKLLDATRARLSRTGLTVKTSFDVKPGSYFVRLVVRDSKASILSSQNHVVEIPF